MTTCKVLVVGEAPSRWMAENNVTIPLPLARRELAALAGIIPPKFDELFECVNVLDAWPGKQGKGDAFPIAEARASVARKHVGWSGYERIVLLGRRVEDAFFAPDKEWLTWHFRGLHTDTWRSSHTVAVCPHPSHVNRWWNEAANRRAAAVFWGELARATCPG